MAPDVVRITAFSVLLLIASAAQGAQEEMGPPLPPAQSGIRGADVLAELKALQKEAHALQKKVQALESDMKQDHGQSLANSREAAASGDAPAESAQ